MAEIPKAYEPQAVEEKWYQFWLDQKCFVADAQSAKPAYSIVIPPPNVTGVLTLGHVLNNTIQDILARKARMEGKEVLWLPGTDHAGIATQTAVEKSLKKQGLIKHRDDLGREKFLEKVWEWKEKHGGIIIQQLKKLGASCDWTRERFTMDPEYSRCVQKVFVELYKKGLIYRGKRMVNWCPASLTALSDEEVVMKQQKGALYYFRVEVVGEPLLLALAQAQALSPRGREGEEQAFGPVTDDQGRIWLTIATTRPETIPGDTAVAVNPKDPRYAHLIGKHVLRPLPPELPREQKLIPIIGDEQVDFAFGTGVLKVTPAHDKADWEIGLRHNLPQVEVIAANGYMNELAGVDLNGLDRFKARKVATEKLVELGALGKEEPYTNNVGYSERADVPIEPRLSEQWFLKYPGVEKSKGCVAQDGPGDAPSADQMRFFPARWAKVYEHWMANIQDWCISRQLWWGHRIPVWYRKEAPTKSSTPDGKSPTPAAIASGPARPTSGAQRGLADLSLDVNSQTSLICCQVESPGPDWTQDPDVLDTWFSSWLWPFATMGWPEQTATLKKFYPTTDLVTGPDIIFFWVARMIMAGYEFMGEMPFRNVYFTGIIRDKQGRKMSKSLGNSPDPLDLIAKFGADALRFGVMRSAPLGQDILFDEQHVELGRNFCNKLWNACRFRQMQGGEVQGEIDPNLLNGDDKWILLKLHGAIREITTSLAEYKFSEATQTLYRFFWGEYCDWYVEATKAVLVRPAAETSPSPLGGENGGSPAERRLQAAANHPQSPRPLPPEGGVPVPSGNGEGETQQPEGTSQSLLTSAATNLGEWRNTLAVIDFVLSHTLRLMHPFLPFITEELWHGMGYHEEMPEAQGGRSIMFAPWPKPFDPAFRDFYSLDDCYLEFTDAKYDLVTQGRNLRREGNIQSGKKVTFILKPVAEMVPHDVAVLTILLHAETLIIDPEHKPGKATLAAHTKLGELYLPLEGLVDLEAETARWNKELEKYSAEILKVEQKLANPAFTQKVPPEVLREHQSRLEEWQAKKQHALAALKALEG